MERFERIALMMFWLLVSLLLASEIVMMRCDIPTFLLAVGWAILSIFTFVVLNSLEDKENRSLHNH